MEISNANNAAVAAFQANVSATNAPQPRVTADQETSKAPTSTKVSISEEAQALFRAEQSPATESAQLQSGDANGEKPK